MEQSITGDFILASTVAYCVVLLIIIGVYISMRFYKCVVLYNNK